LTGRWLLWYYVKGAASLSFVNVYIRNSETQALVQFSADEHRLRDFYRFMVTDRRVSPDAKVRMPGVGGPAIFGLNCIFVQPTLKFPAEDILAWLRNNQKFYLGDYPNPTITVAEIEDALGRFAAVTPSLLASEEAI
jgi:hypothetical protein